ncbi:hypothetical protein CBS101457_005918 [Exobasidium rhododendri]|nr:hypothetical protein CBS101457_005918 [Exobasidium rhododendri]
MSSQHKANKGQTDQKAVDAKRALSALPRVTQSETIQTLNLLYQSAALSALRSTLTGTYLGEAIQRSIQLQVLAKKATLRLDTTIKRSLCKRCNVPLLPGLTCSIQCRTFAPSSRVFLIMCTLCSYKRRIIAPPTDPANGNQSARRNRKLKRRREARMLQAKLIKYKLASSAVKLRSQKPRSSHGVQTGVGAAVPTKLSQRARRRAGKLKAQMIKEGKREDGDSEIISTAPNASKEEGHTLDRKEQPGLVRYPDRIKGEGGWHIDWTKESDHRVEEAICMLRGDHSISVGVGRGGMVGKLQEASIV